MMSRLIIVVTRMSSQLAKGGRSIGTSTVYGMSIVRFFLPRPPGRHGRVVCQDDFREPRRSVKLQVRPRLARQGTGVAAWSDRGAGGQHILHGSVDLGKLEDVAQFQHCAADALPGRHHRRHLTEHQPQHEPRHRQEARPTQRSARRFEKALLLTGFGAVPFSGPDPVRRRATAGSARRESS